MIVLVSIILVIGIGFGVFLAVMKKSKDNREKPTETTQETASKIVLLDDISQDVFVENATLPMTIIQGNVFKIRGIVNAKDGLIKQVNGYILDQDGTTVQESNIKTSAHTHNLKNSINKYLLFGNLKKGKYKYRVTVLLEYANASTTRTIIEAPFEVV